MPAKKKELSVDWYYHRPGCVTCARSQQFLESHRIQVAELVNARKTRIQPQEALALARAHRLVFAARGKKLVRFEMRRDPPPDDLLLAHLIGPSGCLRAPTTRVKDRMFVGFDPGAYLASLFD
jgi:arsenate reductase-like glutaredoxin family protein